MLSLLFRSFEAFLKLYAITMCVGLIFSAHNCQAQELQFTEILPNYGIDTSPSTPVYRGDANFFDFDNDGDRDVIISGYYGFMNPGTTEMFSNDGDGNFILIPNSLFLEGTRGFTNAADIDGDGAMDFIFCGYAEIDGQSVPLTRLYKNNGTGTFSLDESNNFPQSATKGLFADIDADGDQDLLLAGTYPQLYQNDGEGNFTNLFNPLPELGTTDLIFEDLDNDGDLDLIAANDGNSCKLYKNDGTGFLSLVSGTSFPTLYFLGLGVQDIDGDGKKDIALTGHATNGSFVSKLYLGNDDLTFTEGDAFLPHGHLEFFDADGDSDLDILVNGKHVGGEPVYRSSLYRNNGGGNYTLQNDIGLIPLSNTAVSVADIDNDMDMDILLVGADNSDNKVSKLFFNDGTGQFEDRAPKHLEKQKNSDAEFADVDGDGDLDILIAGSTNTGRATILYKNNGQGLYEEQLDTPFPDLKYAAINFADVDGDSDLDVILAGELTLGQHVTRLYTNDGLGQFTFSSAFPAVVYGDVEFSDIDGDEDMDLMLCGGLDETSSNCKIYKNNGTGEFSLIDTPFEDYAGATHDYSGTDINFFDIDGDGDKDLVLANWYGFDITVTDIFLNDGTGIFSYDSSPFEGALFGDFDHADVDGDGDLDILITGEYLAPGNSYLVSKLYLNDGTGEFTVSTQQFTPVDRGEVKFCDIDADGDQDVIIGGSYDNINTSQFTKLYLNNGTGNFTAIDNPFQRSSNGSIDAADIDGDGDLDVLISGHGQNGIATKLWRNGGCQYEGFDNTTICANESITINGNVYNAVNRQGIEFMAGGASDGCDSLVVVYLDIIPPADFNVSTDNANINVNNTYAAYQWYDCDNDFAVIPGANSFEFVAPQNGNYAVEITDDLGCVSLSDCITTFDCSAEIIESSVDSILCAGDSVVVNGTVYNADNMNGIEVFEGVTANGCDSTVTINLTVLAEIDTNITILGDSMLVALSGYASYEWLDCNNGMNAIENATDTSFTATESGIYAVQISNGLCWATSNCHEVIIPEDEEEEIEEPPIGVFPNPSEGEISVQFDNIHESLEVVIVSTFGGEVFNQTFYDTSLIEIELNVPAGIYIMEILDSSGELHTYQFMVI